MSLPRNDDQVRSAHGEQNQPGDGDEDGAAGGGFGSEPLWLIEDTRAVSRRNCFDPERIGRDVHEDWNI